MRDYQLGPKQLCAAISADGRLIARGLDDGTVQILEMSFKGISSSVFTTVEDTASQVAFSADASL